jgi:AcrR family transcriptional regulator
VPIPRFRISLGTAAPHRRGVSLVVNHAASFTGWRCDELNHKRSFVRYFESRFWAMSPRSTSAVAARNRRRILDHGVMVASVEGLDGLTIGRLATDLGMSKAGLIAPFGSKEQLQIAVLDRAATLLYDIMLVPASAATPGLARLRVLVDRWLYYIGEARDSFPGGCLLTTATFEFDARGGAVRDAVAALMSTFRGILATEVGVAIEQGEISTQIEPDQAAFELMGIFTTMNMWVQLFRDPLAHTRARRAVARLLDIEMRTEA